MTDNVTIGGTVISKLTIKERKYENINNSAFNEGWAFEGCNIRNTHFTGVCEFDRCNLYGCTFDKECKFTKSNVTQNQQLGEVPIYANSYTEFIISDSNVSTVGNEVSLESEEIVSDITNVADKEDS